MIDLKPCPFCEGEAEFSIGKYGDGRDWHYVECGQCEAMGPRVSYADHGTRLKEALAEAWNDRDALRNTEAEDARLIVAAPDLRGMAPALADALEAERAENQRLREALRVVERERDAAASLRPLWMDETVTPQVIAAALAQLWRKLGATTQTEACGNLDKMLADAEAALQRVVDSAAQGLLAENARLNAAMLVLGAYLMEKGEAFRVGEGSELLDAYSAALRSTEETYHD